MNYLTKLDLHFKPSKGWINDPNGLVYFDGYYHVFYQCAPNFEHPWHEPMHWGHARTKDFLQWEELPVALFPDMPYDKEGCWSGTATVKDETLYLIYSSIMPTGSTNAQTVSIAYSTDGIHFEKYEKNPVISSFPSVGGPDFRDPAIAQIDGNYYCVMATGNPEQKKARLLLYKSENLLDWEYSSILCEWDDAKYTECPSFMHTKYGTLLTASVCHFDHHYFSVMYGEFDGKHFTPRLTDSIDKGPDQYAGQVFTDHLGRQLMIAWIPGWHYSTFAEKNIGCMSIPRELTVKDGKILAYPPKELQHLLQSEDDAIKIIPDGFVIHRDHHDPVVYKGDIRDLKIIRDNYVIEVFINNGEEIITAIL